MRVMGRRQAAQGGFFARRSVDALLSDSDFIFNPSYGLLIKLRVKKNMKSLPMSMVDKALLNGRNIVETIIGHIKEYSSLRLPKHRSVPNAMTHLIAALVQINSLTPAPIPIALPQ